MSEGPVLSSNYWAHHRNTLILSSALLIVSLPHATATTGEVVGLKMGSAGLPVVVLALLIAATYGIINFYFEWRDEGLKYYQIRSERMISFGKAVDEAVKNEVSIVEPLVERLREFDSYPYKTQYIRDIGDYDRPYDGTWSVVHEFDGPIHQLFADIHQTTVEIHPKIALAAKNLASEYTPEQSDIYYAAMREDQEIRASLEAKRQHWARGFHKAFLNYYTFKVEQQSLVAAQLQPIVLDAVKNLEKAFRSASRARKKAGSTKNDIFHEWSRAIGLGIIIPVGLYATALCHCIGRIGYAVLPSAIVGAVNLIKVAP